MGTERSAALTLGLMLRLPVQMEFRNGRLRRLTCSRSKRNLVGSSDVLNWSFRRRCRRTPLLPIRAGEDLYVP